MKYEIGEKLEDETGNIGIVVIIWNNGDVSHFENDAAHLNPVIRESLKIRLKTKKKTVRC